MSLHHDIKFGWLHHYQPSYVQAHSALGSPNELSMNKLINYLINFNLTWLIMIYFAGYAFNYVILCYVYDLLIAVYDYDYDMFSKNQVKWYLHILTDH